VEQTGVLPEVVFTREKSMSGMRHLHPLARTLMVDHIE